MVEKWVKEQKLFLYKLGFAFHDHEETIEKAIKERLNDQKGLEEITDETFRKSIIEEFQKIQKETRLHNGILIDGVYFQCLYLKYVVNWTINEIASYLSLPEEEVERNVILAFERLIINDTSVNISQLLDYHEGKLSFSDYKSFNQLLQEDKQLSDILEKLISYIRELQQLGISLKPSSYFLEEHRPLSEKELTRKKRRQQFFTMSALLIFVCGFFVSTVGVADLQHKWKLWTTDVVGFGENVYISATDQNIEITVTHVAADERGTILFYEIKDSNDEFQYNMEMHSNKFEIVEKDVWKQNYGDFYSMPRNVFPFVSDNTRHSQGKILLPAIKNETELITVQFHFLEQFDKDVNLYTQYDRTSRNLIGGEWVLKVPVKKSEPRIVDLDKTISINGKEVFLSHFDISPTVTFLGYKVMSENSDGRYEHHDLQFSFLEANGIEYYPNFHTNHWGSEYRQEEWNNLFPFESIYYLHPNEVTLHISRLLSNYDYQTEIEVNYDQLPYTFEFLGSNLTVEEIEWNNPTKIKIVEQFDVNRSYDHIHLNFYHDHTFHHGFSSYSDGVWIDKEGNQFTSYEEITQLERPFDLRYITTEQNIEIYFSDGNLDQSLLPKRLTIIGYSKTELLDEKIKLRLN